MTIDNPPPIEKKLISKKKTHKIFPWCLLILSFFAFLNFRSYNLSKIDSQLFLFLALLTLIASVSWLILTHLYKSSKVSDNDYRRAFKTFYLIPIFFFLSVYLLYFIGASCLGTMGTSEATCNQDSIALEIYINILPPFIIICFTLFAMRSQKRMMFSIILSTIVLLLLFFQFISVSRKSDIYLNLITPSARRKTLWGDGVNESNPDKCKVLGGTFAGKCLEELSQRNPSVLNNEYCATIATYDPERGAVCYWNIDNLKKNKKSLR